jgi:hypothetical protein
VSVILSNIKSPLFPEAETGLNRREFLSHAGSGSLGGLVGAIVGAVAQGMVSEHLKDRHQIDVEILPEIDEILHETFYTVRLLNSGNVAEHNVEAQVDVNSYGADFSIEYGWSNSSPTTIQTNLTFEHIYSDDPEWDSYYLFIGRLSPGNWVKTGFNTSDPPVLILVGGQSDETPFAGDWLPTWRQRPPELNNGNA